MIFIVYFSISHTVCIGGGQATKINPMSSKCTLSILRDKIPIFKEESTLYMGARILKFICQLGSDEKMAHSKPHDSAYKGGWEKCE